jgi:hypothetical protein
MICKYKFLAFGRSMLKLLFYVFKKRFLYF